MTRSRAHGGGYDEGLRGTVTFSVAILVLVLAGWPFAPGTPSATSSSSDAGIRRPVSASPVRLAAQSGPFGNQTGAPGGGLASGRTGEVPFTVVLDPGHGGDDFGSMGAGGAIEKTLALDVAHRLKPLLEMRLGARVILTRDDDRMVSADDRAGISNNAHADLFLSLHFNGSDSPAASGAEVQYMKLDRDAAIAARAAGEGIAVTVQGGGARILELRDWELVQATHAGDSALVAAAFAEELGMRVPMGPRPSQAWPLRVLAGVDAPAVAIEIAYLTNADQEAQAQAAEFQTLVAEACVAALTRARDEILPQARP